MTLRAAEGRDPASREDDDGLIADPQARRLVLDAIDRLRQLKAEGLQGGKNEYIALRVLCDCAAKLDPITQGDAIDFLSDVAINDIGLVTDLVQGALAQGQRQRSQSCDEGMAAGKSPSRTLEQDSDGAFKPLSGGFDVDEINREFSLVLMGSKPLIFRAQPMAPIDDQHRILGLPAFQAWFSNRFTEQRSPEGKAVVVTWAKAWMTHPRRRQYAGVEFFPNPDGAPGMPGYLNLWSGFAIKPADNPERSRYAIFHDHLLNNVSGGRQDRFTWVFAFFAHMVQQPRDRPGVALVMRGKMGSGKTKVGEVFGSLFPRHYFLVDDPRYVTGNFNAHMATCLLLQADEAVWAGDKAAEGRLKGLITAPVQQIEAKGVDAVRFANYVRLIMTSNEDWVVPAGKDERRFTVLDVAPHRAQNHKYFHEMNRELASGGLAHLLGDLLAFDLTTVNLRQVLHTEALLEQKIRSFDSVEAWWFEGLQSGMIFRNGAPWPREVVCSSLFDDYIASADKIGVKRKQEEAVLGIKLKKLCPGIERRRAPQVSFDENSSMPRRPWVYTLPPIDEARASFDAILGQPVVWQALDDGHLDADFANES
jgi:hypothetical protein